MRGAHSRSRRRTHREPRGARSPGPVDRPAGRCGRGGRAGRALIDWAHGQVTRGATFQEPSPRWPPGPGPNRGREGPRGAALPEQSCRACGGGAEAESRAGAGAPGAAPAREAVPLGRLLLGRASPGVPGRESVSPRGGRAPPLAPAPPPSSASCAALQQRGRPAAAAADRGGGAAAEEEPPERAARAQSCGVAFPRRRGAGSRSRPRAFSRRGRGGASGSRSRLGHHGEWYLLSFGSLLQTENSLVFGKLGCLRARSRFALGLFCFCFLAELPEQEDCTSRGRCFNRVSKKKIFFFSFGFVWFFAFPF